MRWCLFKYYLDIILVVLVVLAIIFFSLWSIHQYL